jgi:hypothetical protein
VTYTDSLVTVADVLVAKLEASADSLGLTDVFFGDQDLIPRSPAACVEPGDKTRDLQGATRRTENVFTIYILVYHSEVRSPQSNRKDADTLAEAIESLIHSDATLGGLVRHCYVTQVQSGYARKQNALMRSSRITFEARNMTQLPSSP